MSNLTPAELKCLTLAFVSWLTTSLNIFAIVLISYWERWKNESQKLSISKAVRGDAAHPFDLEQLQNVITTLSIIFGWNPFESRNKTSSNMFEKQLATHQPPYIPAAAVNQEMNSQMGALFLSENTWCLYVTLLQWVRWLETV